MNNTGLLVANDLHLSRHTPLVHTLKRLGVLNTVLTAYQAQEFPLRQRFDYVLADVPCSGEGRIRIKGKKGPTGHRWSKAKPRLAEIQKKIILRGYDLLKNKGEMVYSTCTYNPEENESVVNYLLQERDAEILPINLDFHYAPGISRWGREEYDKRLEQAARFYPHQLDSVGFFVARIGRRA
jgi:16S rRNA C967 or C1407 C5-methylase (RsmB/RsmF family)